MWECDWLVWSVASFLMILGIVSVAIFSVKYLRYCSKQYITLCTLVCNNQSMRCVYEAIVVNIINHLAVHWCVQEIDC